MTELTWLRNQKTKGIWIDYGEKIFNDQSNHLFTSLFMYTQHKHEQISILIITKQHLQYILYVCIYIETNIYKHIHIPHTNSVDTSNFFNDTCICICKYCRIDILVFMGWLSQMRCRICIIFLVESFATFRKSINCIIRMNVLKVCLSYRLWDLYDNYSLKVTMMTFLNLH